MDRRRSAAAVPALPSPMHAVLGVAVAMLLVIEAPALSAAACACNTSTNYATLSEFFSAAGGSGWRNASGWVQPSVPICAWYGVHCSGENVTSIALSSNNLAATLPLAPPTTLVALNLSYNNVAGTLPPSWSSMTEP